MKIIFLGTGAIGFPLAFCNCENCQKARYHRGKSLRKSAAILINDEMLIDLGPDVQTAMMMYDKDMSKVKYLLQTHSHLDHFNEQLLLSRIEYRNKKNQHLLHIIAHPNCLEDMRNKMLQCEDVDLLTEAGKEKLIVKVYPIIKGQKKQLDDYQIKAISTTHDIKNGSLLYVITYNGKSIFYATDTKALTDEAIEELLEYKLELVILDHNFGKTNYSCTHLNEELFLKQINKLKELNIIDANTQIYGTHLSHEGLSYHEEIEEEALKKGYHIAYDGLELEV